MKKNTHEEWLNMSFEQRRANVNCYLVNHTLITVNPCDSTFSTLGTIISTVDGHFQVFKITKNESRNITFVHVKMID